MKDKPPYILRRYRIPREYQKEASAEIKALLKKYRELCKKDSR